MNFRQYINISKTPESERDYFLTSPCNTLTFCLGAFSYIWRSNYYFLFIDHDFYGLLIYNSFGDQILLLF